jgi:hypothetical protein
MLGHIKLLQFDIFRHFVTPETATMEANVIRPSYVMSIHLRLLFLLDLGFSITHETITI